MTIFEINGRRVLVRRLSNGTWEAFGNGTVSMGTTLTEAVNNYVIDRKTNDVPRS